MYQIGEVYARSVVVIGTCFGISMPNRLVSYAAVYSGIDLPECCPVRVATLGAVDRAPAHRVNTGLGPVYEGVGHLLISPGDLDPMIALSLLAGP